MVALNAQATSAADRLALIARQVGMNPAPRSRELFELAELMSILLRVIEAGVFNNPALAATLYIPGTALATDMNRIIDLWQSATGERVKDRPVGNVVTGRTGPAAAHPRESAAQRPAARAADGDGRSVMTYPWAESTQEVSTETTSGESPYGESYYPAGESEWGAPFAPAEAEQGSLEYGQEYGQEALSPDTTEAEGEWESPFTTSGLAADSEIMQTLQDFPKTCEDTTFRNRPWKFGRKNDANLGQVSSLTVVPRAEVFEFQLTKFDVDRHELKRQHRDAIADLTRRVLAGIREQRYSGEPIRVYTYGEASSTASHIHNLELSHNRAFNCLNAIRCEFQKAGITQPVTYGFYGPARSTRVCAARTRRRTRSSAAWWCGLRAR